jgi:2-hydroxychromene-2-carboxylate isomerase
VPSTIIRLSAIDRPARVAAALRRATGGRARVELYIAFDDPCSAVALVDLAQRLAGRPADLVPLPVVARGIPDDPAVQAKREYAIVDARRLARRSGRVLSRDEPLVPTAVAGLAARAMALPEAERLDFCVRACEALWLGGADVDDAGPADEGAVRENERRMARRGPYDTPAAMIGRDWWFAHDRLEQIAERLDDLGWTVAA